MAPFPSPPSAACGLSGATAPEKATARQSPRPLANLERLPLRPQGEYLQASDPGRERLRKAHQPLAAAVQEVPEAAAGSGTQALGGDPGRLPHSPRASAPAALGRAQASQHRTQQQSQCHWRRAKPWCAHRALAASRSARRSAAGARWRSGPNLQPRVAVRARGRVRAPFSCAARQTPFFYAQQLSPFMPRSSERETREDCRLRLLGSPNSVGAPKSLSPAKKLFRLLPAVVRQVPVRLSREAGRAEPPRVHWPAGPCRPESTWQQQGSRPWRERGRKWSWDCRKFGVIFSSLCGQQSPLRPGKHIKWSWREKGSVQTTTNIRPAFGVGGILANVRGVRLAVIRKILNAKLKKD